jgi:hypothetical protein
MSDSLQAALDLLPHGKEFRFVDQLTAFDPGKSGSGIYTVRNWPGSSRKAIRKFHH